MALAELGSRTEQHPAEPHQVEQRAGRSVREVLANGRRAVEMLAEAERLRAAAVADLVEFDALDAHVIDGYATPQRHLIHKGGVGEREARRLHTLVRFCADHPSVMEALACGQIGVEHADTLRAAADHVAHDVVAGDLADLLDAAVGVDVAQFADRVRTWQWRRTPVTTAEDVETRFDQREIVIQSDVFGGARGRFTLDPAAAPMVLAALETKPDPVDSLVPARSLRQRRADQLVAMADHCLNGTPLAPDTTDPETDNPATEGLLEGAPGADCGCDGHEPSGARWVGSRSVDVVIDLPTLLDTPFDLDNHRMEDGRVDWDSIIAGFATTGSAPRPVLEQFFCDASWRQLITAGPRVVLDYNRATPEIPQALRRAVQRRDRRCQFDGCDRPWSWCDVHHLVPRSRGGPTNLQNLACVCRFHHTLIHQAGWQLTRRPDGRLATTSP